MAYTAIIDDAKKQPANAAVIILHGYNNSSAQVKYIVDLARESSDFDQVNFVLPDAPKIPISFKDGQLQPGWFDIYSIPGNGKEDAEGILKTRDFVKDLIKEQTDAGISPERIVIGGYSQGGIITFSTLTTLEFKIGGFFALAGFIPIVETLRPNFKKVNIDTPILQLQGTADQVVPAEAGQKTKKFLDEEIGYTDHTYIEYPGVAHNITDSGAHDIIPFLRKALKLH